MAIIKLNNEKMVTLNNERSVTKMNKAQYSTIEKNDNVLIDKNGRYKIEVENIEVYIEFNGNESLTDALVNLAKNTN